MVTLTPKSDNQFVVAVRSGLGEDIHKTPESLAKYFMDVANGCEPLPSHADIQKSTSKDPVRAAEYFDELADFFFREVVGWDKEKGRSVPGGGQYGIPLAYAGGIENQGEGTLHCHVVIWIRGMASTMKKQLTIPDYNDGLTAFVDSLAHTALPLYKFCAVPADHLEDSAETNIVSEMRDGDDGQQWEEFIEMRAPSVSPCTGKYDSQHDDPGCPSCGCALDPIKIPVLYTTNHVKFAPHVAICSNEACQKKYTHISLRKECTTMLLAMVGVEIGQIETDMKRDMAAPSALPSLQTPSPLQFDIIQREVQRYVQSSTGDQQTFVCQLEPNHKQFIVDAIKRTLAITSVHEHKFCHHGSCFKKGR